MEIDDVHVEVIGPRGSRALSLFEKKVLFWDLEGLKTEIAISCIRNLRFSQIFQLAKAKAMLFLGKRSCAYELEKRALIAGIIATDIESIRIRWSGRDLVFGYTDDLPVLLKQIILQNQYCLTKENVEGKIIIDAGANVGVFSMCAAALGAKKVYAFEPVRQTFGILQQNVASNGFEGIILPVNTGLGDETGKTTLFYDGEGGDGGASIVLKCDGRKIEVIDIATIDSFMSSRGERVGFIKIDTEGYERQVLAGARETITRDKPVLSFSAYHFKEDKAELPKVVNGIRGDYKCTLNNFGEEDFYCE